MKKRLKTMLLALVAMMMPIGAWAFYEPEPEPVVITLAESGIATFYYSGESFAIPEDISASIITGVEVNEDGTVKVIEEDVTGIIPAGCAVILRGDAYQTYSFDPTWDEVSALASNLLLGSDEETTIGEEGYLYFTLDNTKYNTSNSAYFKDWIYVGNDVRNQAHKASLALPVEEYSELAEMLETLDNPHLQHTHGGCEICNQNTGVIVINMSDSYGDGWNGASITVKKDGEELDETVTIEDEDGTEATVTLVYDLESRYTFYWNMGEGDGECSFEIIIDGEQVFYANVDNFEFNEGIFFGTEDPYVVSFNANGGSGSMENVETYESVTLPECTFNAPDGMMFKAWLVGEEEYQPEDEIVVTEDTEIKAVWTVFVPQIVIKMKDLYYDGWNGAYITVKKDGEELGTATVEEDFDTNTVTFTYDPTCEYTFYWTEGDYDNECSFEIRVNGKKVSEALQCESESGPVSDCEDLTTEEPFFTLEATAIAEAAWGTSADAETFTYGTLADAFEAAYTYDEENETYISTEVCYIQLLSDITNYNAYSISGGEYTFDLNGHTISSEGHTLYIANNSNVTIVDNSETKSGKVISSGEGCFAVCVDNSASVTINGGTYESTLHYALNVQGNNSSVTINGGSYVSSYLPVLIGEDCSATIVGGTFKYTGASAIENYGNLVVKGGTFTYDGDVDPDSYYTTINHFGGSIDLSDHPTDAINSIDVTNSSGEDITPGAETILLPEDYCFFDYSDDTPVTVLVYGGFYYIGEEPAKCTIAFDAGDGEGEMEDEIIYVGDYTLPECTFTAPEGMGFKAWLVGEDELQPREVVTIEANTTITAVWTAYVPQIIIKMYDSANDGWHGDAIVVKKNGKEIGTATIEGYGSNGIVRYDYDNTADYTFFWQYAEHEYRYPNECSFEILIDEEEVFAAVRDEEENTFDCQSYENGELIHTIEHTVCPHTSFNNGVCAECGVTGGYCGAETNEGGAESVRWAISEDGTELTFVGQGAIVDYSGSSAKPWWRTYHLTITNIVIGNGITRIGNDALSDLDSFTEITIPSSVTTIGSMAFYGCNSLSTVTFNEGLEVIEGSAFVSCKALTEITIPEGVTEIGGAAFNYCTALTSITIPHSVTQIGGSAFPTTNPCTVYVSCNPQFEYTFGTNTTVVYAEHDSANGPCTVCGDFDGIHDGEHESFYVEKDIENIDITYTRTLPNLMWNALYVPFEIPLTELADNYDVAYINDIRSYDNDENGEIDDMTMEIIRINSGTLNANHPYLIRAKNEEARNLNIVLSDATLYRTEEKSLNCSSMYMEFTITGTYNTLSDEDLEGKYAISTSGAWQKLSAGSSLKPFRLYMEMTPRDGSPVKVEAAALSRIRINMQGEDGNTTGVEILEAPQSINDAVLYDLYGRKVTTPVKGGIYISNGKKVIVK